MEAGSLGDRPLRVVGKRGIDLDRDVPVLATPAIPDSAEEVAGVSDVLSGEPQEELLGVLLLLELVPQLLVVGVTGRKRLLKDGRVRGDADDGVLIPEPS